jgi:putative chitinase
MKITASLLATATGAKPSIAGDWLQPMQAAMDKFQISSMPARISAFLANVGVESNGLTALVEDFHYSAQRLAAVWSYRYAVDPHTKIKQPNATAYRLAMLGPQAIANNVYANRLGNGDEMSGDGWRFRGVGPIQCTGRAKLMRFFAAMGLPPDTDPTELQKPDLGSMSAAWFFAVDSTAMKAADAGNFSNVVFAINGERPCEQNQGPRREANYLACMRGLKTAPVPSVAPAAAAVSPDVHEAVAAANAPIPEPLQTAAQSPTKAAGKKGQSSAQNTMSPPPSNPQSKPA